MPDEKENGQRPARESGWIWTGLAIALAIAVLVFAPWLLMVLVVGHMILAALTGGETRLRGYGRYDGDEGSDGE